MKKKKNMEVKKSMKKKKKYRLDTFKNPPQKSKFSSNLGGGFLKLFNIMLYLKKKISPNLGGGGFLNVSRRYYEKMLEKWRLKKKENAYIYNYMEVKGIMFFGVLSSQNENNMNTRHFFFFTLSEG